MRTWINPDIDRATWGSGAWDDEPDKMQWIDETTGLDCLIVRNRFGALCGYVGLPPDDPRHGVDYDEVVDVDIHGGLTFAGSCQEHDDEAKGICHVPEPERPADVWWLGFDCGHYLDIAPGLEATFRNVDSLALDRLTLMKRYRDIGYVRNECGNLARQLTGTAQ